MIKEIKIPDIGEKVESGLVVGVLVSAGDTIEVDQPIIEIETDKAVVEIPSPEKGKIIELMVKVDDEVTIGQVIARVEVAGSVKEETEKSVPEPEPDSEKADEKSKERAVEETGKRSAGKSVSEAVDRSEPPKTPAPIDEKPARIAPAAPSVRRLARELGADINQVGGSGPGGRISKDDVKAYVKKAMTGKRILNASGPASRELPDFSRWGEVTREKLSKIRSIIADTMSYSWNVVPHVTQFDEADITELETFRKKYGRQIQEAGGRLTVTAILIKVLTAALQRFPRFNASLDMDNGEIIYRNYYNIGIAVDTDRGLIVPVLQNADQKNIRELSVELTDISERTRNKKIMRDELEGGTFTISNQGGIGGTNFTPIVYWPQVAILGVSRSRSHPAHMGDCVESRTILPLALSYDHRIIDGADAARFLRWVVDALEHPLLLNLEN
jgi:pyruvate dehydrogenase E2 component (dihydrolipoamide acetyltransferase)